MRPDGRITIEHGMGDPECYEDIVSIVRDVAECEIVQDAAGNLLVLVKLDGKAHQLVARAREACGKPPGVTLRDLAELNALNPPVRGRK